MISLPAAHRALSHRVLADRLAEASGASFAEAGRWDPTQTRSSTDLGRGFLDAIAVGLHVLWMYQEAWAKETFLSTAVLDASVDRLLGHIGARPGPGTAAVGLQHFRCKAGQSAILGPGFAVRSSALGDEGDATYETLSAIRIRSEHNYMRVYIPDLGESSDIPEVGEEPIVPSTVAGEPGSPAATEPLVSGTVGGALQDRIAVKRMGELAARQAARAKIEAQQLASLIASTGIGTDDDCAEAVTSLCEKLCEAQRLASTTQSGEVVPLSESQVLLARQLRNLESRQSAAADALEAAMGQCEWETDADHAARLDHMVTFLEGFVDGMVQEARDNVVRLRGAAALSRLDRVFGDRASPGLLGTASPGTDSWFLIGVEEGQIFPELRPGDWLVVAEDVERTDLSGRVVQTREYRESVQVVRVHHAVPAGSDLLHTRVTFTPPLAGRYDLDRVAVLGNVALISEGSTVEETGRLQGRIVVLQQGPLTWIRDAASADGRRPEVALFVGDREWTRTDSMLHAGPHDAVFAVETLPGGGALLRVGDGEAGAAPDSGTRIRARYRIGVGSHGSRAAGRIDALSSAHPAIEATFNPFALHGGTDLEPDENKRARGPAAVRSQDRAVSAADLQLLALNHEGVHRAAVFRDPLRPTGMVVVMAGPDGADISEADLAVIRGVLAARVPPGVAVRVASRTRRDVRLSVLLRIDAGTDPLAVLREVRRELGLDRSEDGAPIGLLDPHRTELGADLQLSDIYGALQSIRGLRSSLIRALHVDGEPATLADRVRAGADELLHWAEPDDGSEGVHLDFEEATDR